MKNKFSRTELLIGKAGVEKLKNAKVAVYGIGGVGSYTVEGLARAGVGNLVLIDWDDVDITNINSTFYCRKKENGSNERKNTRY